MSSASDSQNQSFSASQGSSPSKSSSSDSPQRHFPSSERGSKCFERELTAISGSRKNPIPDDYVPSNEAQEKIDMVNFGHYRYHTRQPIHTEGKVVKILNYDAWPAFRNVLFDEYARLPSSILPISISSDGEDSDTSNDAGGSSAKPSHEGTSEYKPQDSETHSETSRAPSASPEVEDIFDAETSDVEYIAPSPLRCEKDIPRKNEETDIELAKRRKEAKILSCVNLPTSLTTEKLKQHIINSKLQGDIMLPLNHMRCYTFDYPELKRQVPRMVLSTALLRLGIASPLHWFIRELCEAYQVAPLQITPNGYRSIVGLYLLYDILGFPKLSMNDVRYFFTLKHSGQDYGYFYFSLWPNNYNKGFKVNNPSNMGTWKSPYYYIYSMPRMRTAFNPQPVFLSQTVLTGDALTNAHKIFDLPESKKDFRKIINTDNLVRCGFLPRGGHCTPPREDKKNKKKAAPRRGKSKINLVDEDDPMDLEIPPFAANAGPAISLARDLSQQKKNKSSTPHTKLQGNSGRAANVSTQKKRKSDAGPSHKESGHPPKAPRRGKDLACSPVGNAFGKLAEEHVGAEDLKSWTELEGAKVDEEMNHLVSQLFYLQLSRSDEIQEQAASLKASKEEVKNLQGSMAKKDEELASLRKLVKDQADEAEKSEAFWKKANEDLVEAANKAALEYHNDLSLARDSLVDAKREIDEHPAQLEAATQRSFAEGTVNFFKSFMKTLPNFDWSPFGEATVDYAARMKIQMEGEAKAEAELAVRPDGEAIPEAEVKQFEEGSVDGDRISEQTADVIVTDAA